MHLSYKVRQLQSCCGIIELMNLTACQGSTAPAKIQTAKSVLTKTLKNGEINMAVATTISRQNHEISCLKKLGFKPKGKTKNPKTGNWITLWTYNR